MKRILSLITALASVAAAVLVASPAHATGVSVSVSVSRGTVGVSQPVSATVTAAMDVPGGGVGTITFSVDGQGVIGTAPVDGVLHPKNALDTLGGDAPEKLCKARP